MMYGHFVERVSIHEDGGKAAAVLSFYSEALAGFLRRCEEGAAEVEYLNLDVDGEKLCMTGSEGHEEPCGSVIQSDVRLQELIRSLPSAAVVHLVWAGRLRYKLASLTGGFESSPAGPPALFAMLGTAPPDYLRYEGITYNSESRRYQLYLSRPGDTRRFGMIRPRQGLALPAGNACWISEGSSLSFDIRPTQHHNAGELLRICSELMAGGSAETVSFTRSRWTFTVKNRLFTGRESVRYYAARLQRLYDILEPDLEAGNGHLEANASFASVSHQEMTVLHIEIVNGKVKITSNRTGFIQSNPLLSEKCSRVLC